jgi:hypothetical protein
VLNGNGVSTKLGIGVLRVTVIVGACVFTILPGVGVVVWGWPWAVGMARRRKRRFMIRLLNWFLRC